MSNSDKNSAGPSAAPADNSIEINEISDMIKPMPVKANYENKAFEHEDIKSKEEVAAAAAPNPFDRTQRPGSMYSLRTTGSSSSRSSVNCTNGRVRCPNIRLKKFFSYNGDNNFLKACADSKKILLPEKDGNFLGNWLLVEISTWDLHREKIVFLCEKSILVIQYDFINGRLYNYKRIMLADLKRVKFGHLKYPEGSFMGDYDYGAVRICWGDDDKLSFLDRWNPFGDSIPFVMFTSHHILYNEKEKETEYYNCDEFIACLEFAISKLPEPSKIDFKEDQVVIENYAGLWSAWYNQNWIGFQLDRNGINF